MPEDFDPIALSRDPELESMLEADAHAGLCPPPDLLFAAEEGVLPAAAGATIREHSAHCLLCQTLLEGLAPAESALTPGQKARIRERVEGGIEAAGPARPVSIPMARRQTAWDFAPIAAILILAMGSFLIFRWMHRPVTPEASSHPMAVTELQHIATLPPPTETAATPREADDEPSPADLRPAFRAYNRGDFSVASTGFSAVATRFPNAAVPALYLGVSQLVLNENAAARTTLTRAQELAAPAQRNVASWYLAVAMLRMGDNPSAAPLLQSVCAATESPYSSRACSLAAQIH